MKKQFTNPTPIKPEPYWDNWPISKEKLGRKIGIRKVKEPEKKKIEKLRQRRSVKLSSTLGGQRELIREMKNKINEIIDILNTHYSKDVRGGKII